jgi:RNase P protein component
MTPSFCPTPEITVKFNDWLKVEEIKVKSLQKKKKRDKEGHVILVKGKIYHDELSILIICSKCKDTHIHKRNFTKAQSTHCTSHNNTERLQYPTLIIVQIMETH